MTTDHSSLLPERASPQYTIACVMHLPLPASHSAHYYNLLSPRARAARYKQHPSNQGPEERSVVGGGNCIAVHEPARAAMACMGLWYATTAIFCAAACRVTSARARSSMLTAKKSRQYRDGRLQAAQCATINNPSLLLYHTEFDYTSAGYDACREQTNARRPHCTA